MSIATAPEISTQRRAFRDLKGRAVEFEYDVTTRIAPDVIIDSPARVSIGSHCTIRSGAVLRPGNGRIAIGNHCTIDHNATLIGDGEIHIGDWSTVGPHCTLLARQPGIGAFDRRIAQQPMTGFGVYLMGDNWLDPHVTVRDDVTLGRGVVVRAGSTVTRSVPMASIADGFPATVVGKRYDGPWTFGIQERGIWSDEMPQEKHDWMRGRARCIARFLRTDDQVLEVGSGEGIVAAILAENCAKLTGCDYSDEAIERSRSLTTGIDYHYANATHLPFEDGSFTAVVMSDVAEHLLPAQLENALHEVLRVLTPDGRAIIATPLTAKGYNTSTYAHIYEWRRSELQDKLAGMFRTVEHADKEYCVFVAQK